MGKRWWLKKKKELGLIPDDGAGKPSMFDSFGLYALFPWLKRPKKDTEAGESGGGGRPASLHVPNLQRMNLNNKF